MLSEYIKRVRNILDEHDTDTSFWSDKELKNWLNEGTNTVAKTAEHLPQRAFIEPTEENEYILPGNCIKVFKVKINGEFIPSIPIQLEGEEKGYYIWKNKIILSQIPKGSRVFIFYYRTPRLMENETDAAELPPQYETIIIPYCLYKAYQKDRKADLAQQNLEEFSARLERMTRNYSNTPQRSSWAVRRKR